MTLLAATPKLAVPPRIRVVTPGVDCLDGDLAIELANAYAGFSLADWQDDIVRAWLAKGEDGLFVHTTCGLDLARQNGKTGGCALPRELFGLIIYGEKIRYSAHRSDTALGHWRQLVRIFGDKRKPPQDWPYPELHDLVDEQSFSNGRPYMTFKNGAAIYIVSRKSGSGRGETVDVNIFDEAQEMDQDELAAALPSQSAAPLGNPQTIYMGTPPDYESGASGEVFESIRDSALAGDAGVCWHEWSSDKPVDIRDKKYWYMTNPNLGITVTERWIEQNEVGKFSEQKFLRERLAYWSKVETVNAVDADAWNETKRKESPRKYEKYCLGVKFSPNAFQVSVTVGLLKEDGTSHCELVLNKTKETASGLVWLINWITERKDRISLVAIDGKSGSQELYDRLHKAGIQYKNMHIMETREMILASTMLNSSLEEKTITHTQDEVLDKSATNSTKRKIGSDGYGFGGDSIPLESLAIANWAALTTKQKPGKQMRMMTA